VPPCASEIPEIYDVPGKTKYTTKINIHISLMENYTHLIG
jgi:hypothetical protein